MEIFFLNLSTVLTFCFIAYTEYHKSDLSALGFSGCFQKHFFPNLSTLLAIHSYWTPHTISLLSALRYSQCFPQLVKFTGLLFYFIHLYRHNLIWVRSNIVGPFLEVSTITALFYFIQKYDNWTQNQGMRTQQGWTFFLELIAKVRFVLLKHLGTVR